ncbi:MAG TPA: hypothetical protein PK878_11420 [bacterium]|nr:hypothetical protein [bacterium]
MNGETSGNVEHGPNKRSAVLPESVRLKGTHERSIDSKARIGLPHPFREILGERRLVLSKWKHCCLALMPDCDFNSLIEDLRRTGLDDETSELIIDTLMHGSHDVTLDREGRIIIPPDMAKYAHLNGKVIVAGEWDKVTIWDYDIYQKHMELEQNIFDRRLSSMLAVAQGRKSREEYKAEIGKEQGRSGEAKSVPVKETE